MQNVFFIQQNFTVGDFAGNGRLLLQGARAAAAAGATVALSPELSLSGYTAEDQMTFPAFHEAVQTAMESLCAQAPPQVALLVGLPLLEEGCLYNAVALIRNNRVESVYKKTELPNYSVFDERRYFVAADNPPLVFTVGDERCAVQICQDIWTDAAASRVAAAGADCTLVSNGSPFHAGKQMVRRQAVAAFARNSATRVFYANHVGAQDELVYDGASFVMDADGQLQGQLPAFHACHAAAGDVVAYPQDEQAVYQALLSGLGDYVRKSGVANGVILGLSGGIDSALVAALAVDALGADAVTAVMMPTQFTSSASEEDAELLAKRLGIRYWRMPLGAALDGVHDVLAAHYREREHDTTRENIQARLRGVLLMALANNHDLLLLATGNKSEFACGYATLYGDMNGAFAPLKDVLKTEVWDLCRLRNRQNGRELIPTRMIDRPPSAELRAHQTDQDTLPPYAELDAIIRAHLQRTPPAKMAATFDKTQLADFYRRLHASEHKRRQAPPGTRISEYAFGRDWRMPLSNAFSHAGDGR